ncbi:MAG: hypothetical protein VX899_17275 [Myxococcota bacterium]|nr:hypothetical protein [Myxococcota bacterium]
MTTALLLLGTGCAPTYTDQYTAMEAVCHWDDYTAEIDAEAPWAVWYPTMDYAAFPSEECVDHLLADLGTDVDAFIAADGVDVYQGVNETGRSYQYTRLGGMLAGLRALLTREYGDVQDHAGGLLVSGQYTDAMLEVVRDTDLSQARAAHYNYLTSWIQYTRPVPLEEDADLQADYNRDLMRLTLWAPNQGQGLNAALLMHEARHSEPTASHTACGHESAYTSDHPLGCDETYEGGSIGFSISAMAVTLSAACQPEVWREAGWSNLRQVNEANGPETMLPEWEADLDAVFLEGVPSCQPTHPT